MWPQILAAIASALVSKGMQAATPQYQMSNPTIPEAPPLDFNALVQAQQQRETDLPKLQLQNRLPQSFL